MSLHQTPYVLSSSSAADKKRAAGGRLRGLEPAVFAEDQHRERLAGRGVDDLLVLRVFVVDLLSLEGELITTLATPSGRLRRWIFPRRRRKREQSGG